MDIYAEIKGINYSPICKSNLKEYNFEEFDINTCESSIIITKDNFKFSLSKWVSPKRTRSYPFARVYDTLDFTKKITVIPIIKDEGKNGDRDFIQWDTVSLMSLLDVYVIFAFYIDAEVNKSRDNKITNQLFDNNYVKSKIIEISNCHSSSLHWNLGEINKTFPEIIENVKVHYSKISKKYKIEFHSYEGIDKFKNQFINGVKDFMNTSRQKASTAQKRERLTYQPKEKLSTDTKATITIKNYLGGLYFFTTDEVEIKENKLFLIEGKHSINSKLPNISDIKDGLLKMILYSNLENITVNDCNFKQQPILKLTSEKINGYITSSDNQESILNFFIKNQFNQNQIDLVLKLFKEANNNKFLILIEAV